jgi:hypothetical protein
MSKWKDIGMATATAVTIAMSIGCGIVAAWLAETPNEWAIVMAAWFCGALGAHANRDIKDRDKHNEMAKWAEGVDEFKRLMRTHTTSTGGSSAPFDWCKCDICEGYRERDKASA